MKNLMVLLLLVNQNEDKISPKKIVSTASTTSYFMNYVIEEFSM